MNDNAFNALAHEQRRSILLDLLDPNAGDAQSGFSTENPVPTDSERRKHVAMYHNHLPKLDDYGYIEWDDDTNEISKGPQFERIRPLLEFVDSNGKKSATLP